MFLKYKKNLQYSLCVLRKQCGGNGKFCRILLTKLYTRYTDMHFSRRNIRAEFVSFNIDKVLAGILCSRAGSAISGSRTNDPFQISF